MEWYYVWWPCLTHKRVAQVCSRWLSLCILQVVLLSDCSTTDINIAVSKLAASWTVEDSLSCYAQGALSYQWKDVRGGDNTVTDEKTLTISQPGNFSYKCTAFVECITDTKNVSCPLTRTVSGFAAGCPLIHYFSIAE